MSDRSPHARIHSSSGTAFVDHLTLRGVDRRHPDRTVLHEIDLTVAPAERVALVGENGSGKTTLMRVAAGLDEPDAGTVTRPTSLRFVHQQLPFDDAVSMAAVLDAATQEARQVEVALTDAAADLATHPGGSAQHRAAATTYDDALAAATLTDVWSLDSRLDRVVAGLGLGGIPRDRHIGAMSGGQRSRLALASALIAHPLALLLDEPTNHLDAGGCAFLIDELRAWPGPVLFATHDRDFIDAVATRVVDLDPAIGAHRASVGRDVIGVQGRSYRGGYTDYLAAKAAERVRWTEQFAREQEALRLLRHEVAVGARDVMHTTVPKSEVRVAKKFYSDKASTVIARRVRSARTRLETLEREQVAKPPTPLTFSGFGARSGHLRAADDAVVTLTDVAVPGRLAPVSVTVRARDRLLVTGPNGSGKSTLLAVLTGALEPATGSRRAGRSVRIGALVQDVVWADSSLPVVTAVADVLAGGRAQHDDDEVAEAVAATGLVAPRDLRRSVGSLSLGQQRRTALAALVVDPPDVLVLDEPTNHLSLTLSEELEAALPAYPGAVVVASHDTWLASRWTGTHLDIPSRT